MSQHFQASQHQFTVCPNSEGCEDQFKISFREQALVCTLVGEKSHVQSKGLYGLCWSGGPGQGQNRGHRDMSSPGFRISFFPFSLILLPVYYLKFKYSNMIKNFCCITSSTQKQNIFCFNIFWAILALWGLGLFLYWRGVSVVHFCSFVLFRKNTHMSSQLIVSSSLVILSLN